VRHAAAARLTVAATMPIYEYLCRACGHRTEILHGINDEGPQFCPACGAEGKLRKAISAPSIVFKGSGWAKKDRRPAPAASKKSTGGDGEAGAAPAKPADSAAGDSGASNGASSSKPSESGSAASSRTPDSGGD
jgi:putative FmdB family regulatory protein